ncbi:all3515 family Zur-repressed PEP-CTERM protein [Botrimarina hoheduenensis]|uniref:PEP-CTERM protein-sorting domain-containing protein n=1 Tax=Botrimarina hoheduenensis TaxID=2528000 RepID=A0A5C5VXQ7_9BACT|nr:all3515 family Zur-repressed PEP-CTERM protein [Botrimarina hoheduenensis]TWT43230.1 hypothetical protein Pla111_21800 [Botrimarina hoheduenensis]
MTKHLLSSFCALVLIVSAGLRANAAVEPGINLFHVGIDNAEFVNFGPFAGNPNPNYQRLVLLFTHTFVETPTSNHFHRIGAYSYVGNPAAIPPQQGFSTNDRVPEPYQLDDGLGLLPGSGVFAGQLISGIAPTRFPTDSIELEYGDLTIKPVDNLYQYDNVVNNDGRSPFHPGHHLLNASGGAYKSSVAGVTVGMELVSISPGLSIFDTAGSPLWQTAGDIQTLGTGDSWSLTPVFAVDDTTPLAKQFEATFIFRDRGTTGLGDSAPFTFAFVTIPEPSAAALALLGLCGLRRR